MVSFYVSVAMDYKVSPSKSAKDIKPLQEPMIRSLDFRILVRGWYCKKTTLLREMFFQHY
jgi:hypothetical protein